MADLPDPLTPPDCDLRDFAFMPLDVSRLRDSDLSAEASGDEFRAAVLLWCASWHQIPAGSLPNDDKIIAHLSGYGRAPKEWKRIKSGALRGFILCSDNRFYHPHVADKANDAWESRGKFAEKREKDRERLKEWRERKRDAKTDGKPNGNDDETRFGNIGETRTKPLREGQGIGDSGELPLDKSNGATSDSDKVFWDTAKAYLADVSRDPGALVGKWCRDHGKTETASALTRAQLERPVEKIPFIQGCLRKRQAEAERPIC